MKESIEITFDVAMDKEQKELKNVETVSLTINFPETCMEQLQKDAVAHMKVKFQSQIRSHWTKFIENGVPAEVTYGTALFGGTRTTVRAPTTAEV